jgi:RES domain-containing protein
MVYLGTSRALALLEILVHLGDGDCLQQCYVMLRVDFEARLARDLPAKQLPRGWDRWPAGAPSRSVGDAWIARKSSLFLRVPSVIVPEECILLMNPAHPDAKQVKIGRPVALNVDPRLVRKH